VGRRSLPLLIGLAALLLTPGAAGGPTIPGDPTPPVVTPIITGTLGLNGWYVSSVTLNWRVEDPESLILETQGCDARTLTADTVGTRFTCYARSDGGETTVSVTIRIDRTAPVVSATAARGPDRNGWYNHALPVTFAGSDATSGIDSCTQAAYSGPDDGGASVSGSCRDMAGNDSLSSAFALRYDATAPQVTATARAPDRNGWYNHPLTVTFAGTDATSGPAGCISPPTYSGPDSGAASVAGWCDDVAGNRGTRTFALSYDATAPQATGASAARPPDRNGWYNHALTVAFAGTDGTSGIDVCTQASYAGPDNGAASVSGNCRDSAGNQSGSSTFALRYDATAPQVTNATAVRPPDRAGWYNHPVVFAVQGVDTTSGVDSCPPATYAGPTAVAPRSPHRATTWPGTLE
jgi:hypothetical protein